MCAEAWGALSLVHMRTFSQTDLSVLLPFRQCVDIRILKNYSLPWTQIHTVPCHFVSVGLSAIAQTLPSTSTVPVDPQWTQTTSATSGNLHGKGGREIWPQGEEGLTHESMTIFSGPLGWHGALIHSSTFLFLLSFPQRLMVAKFLNWARKERGSPPTPLRTLSQMWQLWTSASPKVAR